MALIVIKPSPLSKNFTAIIGEMEKLTETTVNGRTEYRSLGAYKQERLPGSSQIERPITFSQKRRRWLVKGFDGSDAEKLQELNDLVKRCNLINDIRNHPQNGQMITDCDLYNSKDPFFLNLRLKMNMNEGEGILDTSNPLDRLLYLGALENNRFAVGGDQINPALSRRAKYIIVDKEVDLKVRETQRDMVTEVVKKFENQSDEKKMIIAMAMGLIRTESSDVKIVKDLLWTSIFDTTPNKAPDGKSSMQEYYLKMSDTDPEDLNIRHLVEKAIAFGVIRRVGDGTNFEALGIPLGKDRQQVLSFFLDPKNSDVYFKIRQALDNL